ncbi:PPOX class F420-dependent oxidoreductase [Rhodococcus sp. D2-41]|uniref:PPOX class F420-dependent oxidoreductase n=1 Tax=Speluncibacter jeojiensis TaxID=2710754 RepID=UPI00240FD336|nr:PPOX class F420-dependent oxidoreductase [Rhodococcus sp. D2-41]MDG3012716.1 PPOX class F420-dependent oxidoreductase [Rhodococcus sp. D2-41]
MSPYQKELEDLFGDRGIGTLVTLKRDGRPQLSNVMYHFDKLHQRFEISVTDTRAKTTNMRRDPRVSLQVNGNDGWSYAVVEGRAELTPHAEDPHDLTVNRLVELYRTLQGEHPDWDEFREAMVRERRLLLTVIVERVYGMAGS